MPIQKNPKTGEYRSSCKCGWKSPGSLDKSSAEYALSRHEEAQHGGKYSAKTSSTRKKRFEVRFKASKTGGAVVSAYVMAVTSEEARKIVMSKYSDATIESVEVSKGPKKTAYRS